MKSFAALLAFFVPVVGLASEAQRPDVTVAVDRSRPAWKVTVKNHGPGSLRYSLLDGRPRLLGIEYWYEERGFVLYAWDLASTLHFHPFASDDRDLLPGKTVTFFLDPKDVSAERDEAVSLWKKQLEEFDFYDCRVFFQDYASVRFNAFDDQRAGMRRSFEERHYTNTEIFVSGGDKAEQRALFTTYQRVVKGEAGLKPRGEHGAIRRTLELFGVEFLTGTHVALDLPRQSLVIRHHPEVLDDIEFRFDLRRKVDESEAGGEGEDEKAQEGALDKGDLP